MSKIRAMTCHPDDTTVVVPTIPPRLHTHLPRALKSIADQTHPAAAISVALDLCKQGAAHTRQRALDAVRTPWTAFLDDDDTYYPAYLETLHRLQTETDADFLWGWFDGNPVFEQHRGRQMDSADPHHTTMTVMVRTELAQAVGFTQTETMHPDWAGEDWQFILGCVKAGAKFAHTPDLIWTYNVHSSNTSGLGSRW